VSKIVKGMPPHHLGDGHVLRQASKMAGPPKVQTTHLDCQGQDSDPGLHSMNDPIHAPVEALICLLLSLVPADHFTKAPFLKRNDFV
jgi:hypothetical protein